jgi:hypothetical protein
MTRYFGFIVAVLFIILSVFPSNAHAQITPTAQVNPSQICVESGICIPTKVGGFVSQYYAYGLGFIGGLALLFIMYGGYVMLTSQGNPARLNNGKAYIGYAIISLLLAIFGYVFVQTITVGVLKIPGFS